MTKLFLFLGILFFSFGLTSNAIAHSGSSMSVGMHSMLHIIVAGIFLSLMVAGFFWMKRSSKVMKERVKK